MLVSWSHSNHTVCMAVTARWHRCSRCAWTLHRCSSLASSWTRSFSTARLRPDRSPTQAKTPKLKMMMGKYLFENLIYNNSSRLSLRRAKESWVHESWDGLNHSDSALSNGYSIVNLLKARTQVDYQCLRSLSKHAALLFLYREDGGHCALGGLESDD